MPESSSEKAAAKELLRLRRLPENRRCANCLKEDEVGFKSIVVPFKTFVCSTCKSAHQSFSHLCKTADMSTWTMDQVKALDDKNGGGNRLATEKWMGSMPDSERPGSSDTATLEALKRFVDRVYNEKRWENKDAGTTPSKSPTPSGRSGSTKGTSVSGRDTTPTKKRSKSKDEKGSRHEEDFSGNEKVKKDKKSKKEKKESKEKGRGDQWGPTVSPHSTEASTTAGWSDYPSLGSAYGTGGSTGETCGSQQQCMPGMAPYGMESFNSNSGYHGYDYNAHANQNGQIYSCHSSPRTHISVMPPAVNPQSFGQVNYGCHSTPPAPLAMPQATSGSHCAPPAPGFFGSSQKVTSPAPGWGQPMLGGPSALSSQVGVTQSGRNTPPFIAGQHQTNSFAGPAFSQTGPAFLGSGHAGSSASSAPCLKDAAFRAGAIQPPDGSKDAPFGRMRTYSAPQETTFQNRGNGHGVEGNGGDFRTSPAPSSFKNVPQGQPPAKSDLLHSWRQGVRGTSPPVLSSRSASAANFSSCRQRSLPPPTNATKGKQFSRPSSTVDSRSHQGAHAYPDLPALLSLGCKEPLTLHSTNPWAADLGAKIIPASSSNAWPESGVQADTWVC